MTVEDTIRSMTFAQVLRRQASERGDKLYLNYLVDGRQYTFRDTYEQTNRIANGLLARGIGKGAHVASVLRNSPEQLLFGFALGVIGAVSIPLNPASHHTQLEYFLSQSDAQIVCVSDELLDGVLASLANTAVRTVIVVRESANPLPQSNVEMIDFNDLYDGSELEPDIDVRFSDLAAIKYTSGTTGPSKGNMFCQSAYLCFSMNIMERLQVTEDDIYYVCFPLYHASGWNAAVLTMLQLGGGIALTRQFSASNYLTEARNSRSTLFNLLSVGDFLLGQEESESDRDHSLRVGLAAPMPARAVEFEKRFGAKLVGAYGLTDFSCVFTLAPDESDWKRLSTGRPHDNIEVKLVDENDFEVAFGVPGELLVRHKNPWMSASGYYNMPEATSESRRDLWFRTGDRFYRDEDNFFFFIDRKKDSIRRRGENISSYELESILFRHPAIAEAAALGLPASTGEDDVAVSVVLKEGVSLREEELIAYCVDNMPRYMVPRFVDLTHTLPRTTTGKVVKYKIKEAMMESRDRLWDLEAGSGASNIRAASIR
jgi:carnitine-CoA ligase